MQCNQCGQLLRKGQSAVLKLQTGKSSSGKAYFRNVNLCPKCLAEQEARNQTQARMRLWIVVVVFLGAIAAGVYFYLNRL